MIGWIDICVNKQLNQCNVIFFFKKETVQQQQKKLLNKQT